MSNLQRTVPLVVIVGADKGGVGKTIVTRALLDYLANNKVQARSFDTEPGNVGVLKRFFPKTVMLNAATVAGQMEIIDSAQTNTVTVVDARAGLLGPLLKTFNRIDLLNDVRSGQLGLLVLHVVGSSVASASEIPEVIQAMQGANLVRVNNRVNEDAAFPLPVYGETTIDIPHLDEIACAAVDQKNSSFVGFITDTGNSRILRGHVRSWLGEVFTGFNRADIRGIATRDSTTPALPKDPTS